jgi:hypothetical protein
LSNLCRASWAVMGQWLRVKLFRLRGSHGCQGFSAGASEAMEGARQLMSDPHWQGKSCGDQPRSSSWARNHR